MSQQVINSFIQAFAPEIHMLFQQEGSILKNTVEMTPNSPNLVGNTDRVQRLGLGNLTSKGRHAPIPAMNLSHDFVDVPVDDFYGLEWVDKLDQNRSNVNWRLKYARELAMSAGRKYDDVIIDALDSTTSTGVALGAAGLTKAKILEAKQLLDEREVPQNMRFFAVGAMQVNDLFTVVSEFGNQDFVADRPFTAGSLPAAFLGFRFVLTNRLPVDGSSVRTCFAYQSSAINRASGQEPTPDAFWDGERQSWGIALSMAVGAAPIEDAGIVEVACQE
jgi:hypothetical protein